MLGPAQAAAQHQRQDGPVAAALQVVNIASLEQFPVPPCSQPGASRTPIRLAPLTRRMPAARSGLSSPMSAASKPN
jgi:hypothetical protein